MLASFKKGNIGGVKVHVDRLQVLLYAMHFSLQTLVSTLSFFVCIEYWIFTAYSIALQHDKSTSL